MVMRLGYETISGTSDEAAARVKSDVVRWTKIIHDAGIEPQ
jgi:tripartite-type tricarboxylate transporter receptor subunit TctC